MLGRSGGAQGQSADGAVAQLTCQVAGVTALQRVQELLALNLILSSHIFRRLAMFEKLLFLES